MLICKFRSNSLAIVCRSEILNISIHSNSFRQKTVITRISRDLHRTFINLSSICTFFHKITTLSISVRFTNREPLSCGSVCRHATLITRATRITHGSLMPNVRTRSQTPKNLTHTCRNRWHTNGQLWQGAPAPPRSCVYLSAFSRRCRTLLHVRRRALEGETLFLLFEPPVLQSTYSTSVFEHALSSRAVCRNVSSRLRFRFLNESFQSRGRLLRWESFAG